MAKRKIFIVEDEAVNALLIKHALQNDHDILGIAASGEEAIIGIMEKKPDFIIVDIRLNGDMSGISMMNEINRTMQIEHIYCTAYSDEVITSEAMKTGPLTIIIKPLNVPKLKKILMKENGH